MTKQILRCIFIQHMVLVFTYSISYSLSFLFLILEMKWKAVNEIIKYQNIKYDQRYNDDP